MSSIHSPFRYAGGKYYARKLILSRLPPHSAYCEPFAGGGSIFFAKNKVSSNWLNDLDEDLIQVYTTIRDEPEALIDFLATTAPPTRESHFFYKNNFVPQTSIEHAGRWYYLNRISYSGIMKMQNCFWGYGDKFSMRPENWPRSIRSTSEKLQSVTTTTKDFEDVINNIADSTLLFIDPPYFNADQDKFYTNTFTLDEHRRLANVLHQHSHRVSFLLTYDDCSEIRAMYGWVENIESNEWNYCISRSDDQSKKTTTKGKRPKGKELFIRNYELSHVLDQLFADGSNHDLADPAIQAIG